VSTAGRGDGDEPRSVRDALAQVSRELGLPDPEHLTRILARWPEMVGAVVAEHARPRSLREGVLTVEVDAPAWATQLRYLEAELVARVDREVAAGAVGHIRVVVAGATRDAPGSGPAGPRDTGRAS
jgi:predicted nucleic acid-binding Zn ribbon protein